MDEDERIENVGEEEEQMVDDESSEEDEEDEDEDEGEELHETVDDGYADRMEVMVN